MLTDVTVKTAILGAPIFPARVMSPDPAAKVRLKTPLTVLPKVKFPPPELRRMGFVIVMGAAIDNVPVVEMLDPKETVPEFV